MKFVTKLAIGLVAVAPVFGSVAAEAKSASGNLNGVRWNAESRIVGVTSTATLAGGGNPLYFAPSAQASGVVALIMDYGGGNRFICSGTLLPDRKSILTAGHCVSNGGSGRPLTTTAYFNNGSNPDSVVTSDPASVGLTVSQYHVNPGYTGEVIDQNDIAVLTLSGLAPAFATAFGILNEGDITGSIFNVAGYGGRSNAGGNIGANLGTGRLRQGLNRYDFRLGDAAFGGFFAGGPGGFFGNAANDFSFLSDFDNGLAANDASCQLSVLGFGNAPDAQFCNLGTGAREVSVAGGDSGGPQFVNGKIASVTSYGLSFGGTFGDIRPGLNSSFGEFNGFVPTYIHAAFISNAIPEPASWALMIAGFGLVGGAMRRRKTTVAFQTA